jgi:hypothetical protein
LVHRCLPDCRKEGNGQFALPRAREQAHPDEKALSYFSCILHKAFDIVTQNRLHQYLCDLKSKVDASQFISTEDKVASHALANGAIKWMEENPNAVRADYHAKGSA